MQTSTRPIRGKQEGSRVVETEVAYFAEESNNSSWQKAIEEVTVDDN